MLDVQRLCAWYGKAQILFDVSLAVGAGECVALMGRNGAGKSTTLKAIMGLLARRGGRVRFEGRDVSTLAPYQVSRRRQPNRAIERTYGVSIPDEAVGKRVLSSVSALAAYVVAEQKNSTVGAVA